MSTQAVKERGSGLVSLRDLALDTYAAHQAREAEERRAEAERERRERRRLLIEQMQHFLGASVEPDAAGYVPLDGLVVDREACELRLLTAAVRQPTGLRIGSDTNRYGLALFRPCADCGAPTYYRPFSDLKSLGWALTTPEREEDWTPRCGQCADQRLQRAQTSVYYQPRPWWRRAWAAVQSRLARTAARPAVPAEWCDAD
ncbi:MAG TPA: hypothetical protein VFU47_16775 [Armatimonadota bacterium]|nr:hypothetical protein [Armatimonadota bacterium]